MRCFSKVLPPPGHLEVELLETGGSWTCSQDGLQLNRCYLRYETLVKARFKSSDVTDSGSVALFAKLCGAPVVTEAHRVEPDLL